jgi:hypothetical protein
VLAAAAALLAGLTLVMPAAAAFPSEGLGPRGGGPVKIKISSPTAGQTVSGTVQWQVSVLAGKVNKVSFSVDNKLIGTDSRSPYLYALDTTKLADGSHGLQATANGSASTSVTVTVTTSNASSTQPGPPGGQTGQKRIYWGAWIGTQFTGEKPPWDMNAVTAFEQIAGKGVSLVHFSTPAYNCSTSPCTSYPFPGTLFDRIRSHGSIPFFSWASDSWPVTVNEPDFQLRDVTAGTYDGYFRDWATAAKNWGHPFFLRFNFEMNGDWFPWAERANGNQPGDFVAAWRHVHDIFTSVGATKTTWVWCPDVDPNNALTPLAGLYPGDAYVDWTCLDGYNKNTPWLTFDQLFRSSYDAIVALAPSKPVAIAEIASIESGGSKAAWITDTLAKVAQGYPQIRAFLWFEHYTDWPIETSSTAQSAFAQGIASPAYVPNDFG